MRRPLLRKGLAMAAMAPSFSARPRALRTRVLSAVLLAVSSGVLPGAASALTARPGVTPGRALRSVAPAIASPPARYHMGTTYDAAREEVVGSSDRRR